MLRVFNLADFMLCNEQVWKQKFFVFKKNKLWYFIKANMICCNRKAKLDKSQIELL